MTIRTVSAVSAADPYSLWSCEIQTDGQLMDGVGFSTDLGTEGPPCRSFLTHNQEEVDT